VSPHYEPSFGATDAPLFEPIFHREGLIQLLIHADDGSICMANAAACAFYGYDLEHFRRLRIQDINLLAREDVLREMSRAEAQQCAVFSFKHRLADGRVRDVEVSSGPIMFRGRRHLHSVVFDVTERVRAAQEARRLATVLRSTADAVIVTNEHGVIEAVNEAFTTITGYSSEEAVGEKPSILKSGAQDPDYYRELWAAITAGASWRGVLINTRRNGENYHASLTVSPVKQGEGYVAIQRDITEIVAARDRAEEATRAKSTFLANMSHEIRTPLNGIIGIGQLLERLPLGETEREYVEVIRRSSRALLDVVNDVLDYSKIGAGHMELEKLPFSLGELLDDCLSMAKTAAKERDLDLVCDSEQGLPGMIVGDPGHLRQVLVNLLSNAVKFTESGQVILRVRAVSCESATQVCLRFEVQDTGIGIAENKQADLFSAFTQADPSTTRRFGGTGLGLAISQSLVTAMGSSIQVKSAPAEGSCFWFELGFEVADDVAPGAQRAESGVAQRPNGPPRVLVAEDNAVNRLVAVRLLQAMGAQVQVAQDGQQALSAARAHAFDLILMDVHMPVMDGLEATRRLRASPPHSKVPIVALTAAVSPEDRVACAEAGMTDYLSKPFRGEDLQRLLRQYCR